MTHWTYVLVLAGCLGATLPLNLVFGLHVFRRPRRLVVALVPEFVVFVTWDLYAVHAGQWSYDPRHVVGLTLPGGLPIEEVLFFVVIPLCAVLCFESVTRVCARTRPTSDAADVSS